MLYGRFSRGTGQRAAASGTRLCPFCKFNVAIKARKAARATNLLLISLTLTKMSCASTDDLPGAATKRTDKSLTSHEFDPRADAALVLA